jgi:hypothetical protein
MNQIIYTGCRTYVQEVDAPPPQTRVLRSTLTCITKLTVQVC